ncbi:MAG: CpXC domain-containing protein [Treponema sp.]|jgi:hypothetical protein|nr:CpXC domain-containing protein [Treponema sp.]
MKRNISCLCGKDFSVEVEEEIDLDGFPEHLEKICSGAFMSFVCPLCEKKHKPEFPLTIVWKSKNLKLEVLPELDRGDFYRRKKRNESSEAIIGYPEMADRITVVRDDLEPAVIEALKYYLLLKAEETYPGREINAWYYGKVPEGIEFHLDGIKEGEMAVMKVPHELYDKTAEDYRRHPKNEPFTSLRSRSYLSIQNILRPNGLK